MIHAPVVKSGAMTINIMTHRIMSLSLNTLSIKGLFVTLSIKDTQHK